MRTNRVSRRRRLGLMVVSSLIVALCLLVVRVGAGDRLEDAAEVTELYLCNMAVVAVLWGAWDWWQGEVI